MPGIKIEQRVIQDITDMNRNRHLSKDTYGAPKTQPHMQWRLATKKKRTKK